MLLSDDAELTVRLTPNNIRHFSYFGRLVENTIHLSWWDEKEFYGTIGWFDLETGLFVMPSVLLKRQCQLVLRTLGFDMTFVRYHRGKEHYSLTTRE